MLNWTFFYLCESPDKMRKLQRELDDIYLEIEDGFKFNSFH